MISQGESDPGRKEHDSFGDIEVPAGALWGAQTERARRNFAKFGGGPLPEDFIAAVALIKAAAARANARLGLLPEDMAKAIQDAVNDIAAGRHKDQFPVDVYQTGSGTSTNMNVNEVIAHLASTTLGKPVHPNDHVNMCQSSNDVIPSAIHLSALSKVRRELYPSLEELRRVLRQKEQDWSEVYKTGRTHLMDAMPMTLGQEASGWRAQIDNAIARLKASEPRLQALAQGGTAVGTGINAHEKFAATFIEELRDFHRLAAHAGAELLRRHGLAGRGRGNLRPIAHAGRDPHENQQRPASDEQRPAGRTCRTQIAGAATWQQHHAGQGESGDPEAVAMVAAQVMGHDAAIAIAGQSGNFQLNVMLPLIASNLLAVHSPAEQRGGRARKSVSSGRRAECDASQRSTRAQSHSCHGAESGDRLRARGCDRQAGLR